MSEEIDVYIEKIKNEDDFFSKAKLIKFLIDKKGLRIIDVAKKMGLNPSYICHILRLNRIPEIIIDGYYAKLVTLSHLFVISRIKDQDRMIKIYEQILTDNLTVFQTEVIARDIIHNVKDSGNYLTKENREELIKKIEKKITDSKTKINQSRIKGVIRIEIKGSLNFTSKKIEEIIDKIVG